MYEHVDFRSDQLLMLQSLNGRVVGVVIDGKDFHYAVSDSPCLLHAAPMRYLMLLKGPGMRQKRYRGDHNVCL